MDALVWLAVAGVTFLIGREGIKILASNSSSSSNNRTYRTNQSRQEYSTHLSVLESDFANLVSRAKAELNQASLQSLTRTLQKIKEAEPLFIAEGMSAKQARAVILTEGTRTIKMFLQVGN